MEQLKDNDDIIVIQADKTGAPVIMDREEQYIKNAFQQHLGDENKYKQI